LGPESWEKSFGANIAIRAALPRKFVGKFLGGGFSFGVAVRALRAVSGGIENEDSTIAERDFGGLPGRALVEPLGVGL